MHLISRLTARWNAHGIQCPAGVAPEVVAGFELRHRIVVPSDMREYFLTVNGMGPLNIVDDDLFNFLPLQDVVTIAEQLPDRCSKFAEAPNYFIFADHSIALPSYAIRLSSNVRDANPVASVFSDFGNLEVEVFFNSFSDFVNHYLDDPHGTSAALPKSVASILRDSQ
jgi:hypothetical protein